jgi:hypothetical protein
MHDDRMLGVSREQRGFKIERIRGCRKHQVHNTLASAKWTATGSNYCSTTIVPVIFG